jgi:hypothetical protein
MENLRADGHRGMGIAGMDKVEIQPRRDWRMNYLQL